MADITLQTAVFTSSAIALSFASAAASDKVQVDSGDRVMVAVANASGSPVNVTIPAVQATANVPGVGTVDVPDLVVAVADGVTKHIGPIPPAYVGTDGRASVNYSATTSVTRAAYRVPAAA